MGGAQISEMLSLSDELTKEQEDVLSVNYEDHWKKLKNRGASGLTDDEYGLLVTIDRAPKAEQDAMMDEDDGPKVADMFCNLLRLLKSTEKKQQLRYVSLWLRIPLTQNPARGSAFFKTNQEQGPLKPFVDVMFRNYGDHTLEIQGNVSVAASVI